MCIVMELQPVTYRRSQMKSREASGVRRRRAPKRKDIDTSGLWWLRSRSLGGGRWGQELKSPASIFLAFKDT